MPLPNGRTSSFLERLRSPQTMGGSSWRYNAPTADIRAGEMDPIQNVQNMIEMERRQQYALQLQQGGNQPRGLQQVGRGMGGGGFSGGPGTTGHIGTIAKPMDVVYDQGPEQFQKQLNLQKDRMNLQQKNVEADRATQASLDNDAYIDNRRKMAFAERTASNQMTDQAKLAMQFANAQALESQRGANNLAERNLQNKGAYDVALDGRKEAARGAAELARINTAAKSADVAAAGQIRLEAANTPKAQSEAMDLKLRQLKMSRPDLAAAFNDDGSIKTGADPNLLAEISRAVMPRREGDINLPGERAATPNIGPVKSGAEYELNRFQNPAFVADTEGVRPGPPTNMSSFPEIGARPLARYETGKDPGNPNQQGTRLTNLAGQNSLSGGTGSPFLPITRPGATAQTYAADLKAARENPPPQGAKPGGKWIVTASGRRVYREP